MTEEIKLIREAIERQKREIDRNYDNLERLLSRLELLVEEYHDIYNT